jgi:adenylosuccinate lyase
VLQVESAWTSCCSKQQDIAASVAASTAELAQLCAELAHTAVLLQQQQPAELSQVSSSYPVSVVYQL